MANDTYFTAVAVASSTLYIIIIIDIGRLSAGKKDNIPGSWTTLSSSHLTR